MSCTAPLQSLRGVLRVWGSLRRAPETLKLQSTIGRCFLCKCSETLRPPQWRHPEPLPPPTPTSLNPQHRKGQPSKLSATKPEVLGHLTAAETKTRCISCMKPPSTHPKSSIHPKNKQPKARSRGRLWCHLAQRAPAGVRRLIESFCWTAV